MLKMRKQKGWTQKEAAEKCEIQPSTYSSYENNRKVPPLDIALRLADAFGVPVDWLCGRKEPMYEHYTYGSAARSILRLVNELNISVGFIELASIELETEYGNDQDFRVKISSKDLCAFFRKATKYEQLVKDIGEGNELYKAWVDKELSELDKKEIAIE